MTADVEVLPLARPRAVSRVVESEVVGMVIFVFAEVMFFAGFLSAYNIISQSNAVWPPVTDPPLPAGPTALASVALLLSGVAVFASGRQAARVPARAVTLLWAALVLAGVFVVWQVVEGSRLVRDGLTLISSAHGAFFYTIVGAHALHAVVAIGVLLWATRRLELGSLSPALFRAVRIFWYFVVGLWPVLYLTVYR